MQKALLFVAGLTVCLLGFSPEATAIAQTEQVYGLNINPFIIESDVAKGGSTSGTITVSNWTDIDLNIEVVAKDFIPNYETGQPIFVPDDEVNDKTYSLAQWIKLAESNNFKLKAGQTKEVRFSLNPPPDAEQGSHYGALLFNYKAPVRKGSIGQVTQTVGTVILVSYGVGREMGEGSLSVNQKSLFVGDGFEFFSKFKNTGNVHLKPKGEIHIKNLFGKVVASVPVNRDAEVLLPGVEKTFQAKWFPTGLTFGRYVAEANLVYGKNRLESKDKVVIWVLSIHIMLLIGLIVGGLAWFALRGIHIYNRWLISQIEKAKKEP